MNQWWTEFCSRYYTSNPQERHRLYETLPDEQKLEFHQIWDEYNKDSTSYIQNNHYYQSPKSSGSCVLKALVIIVGFFVLFWILPFLLNTSPKESSTSLTHNDKKQSIRKEEPIIEKPITEGIKGKTGPYGNSFRIRPSRDSREIQIIPDNTEVLVDTSFFEGGYVRIAFDGKIGYMKIDFLELEKKDKDLFKSYPKQSSAKDTPSKKRKEQLQVKIKKNIVFSDGEIDAGRKLYSFYYDNPNYDIWVIQGKYRLNENTVEENKYIFDSNSKKLIMMSRAQMKGSEDHYRWTIFHDIIPEQFRSGIPFNDYSIKASLSPFERAKQNFPIRYDNPEIAKWP